MTLKGSTWKKMGGTNSDQFDVLQVVLIYAFVLMPIKLYLAFSRDMEVSRPKQIQHKIFSAFLLPICYLSRKVRLLKNGTLELPASIC